MEAIFNSISIIFLVGALLFQATTISRLRNRITDTETLLRGTQEVMKDSGVHMRSDITSLQKALEEVKENAPAEVVRCPGCEQLVPRREFGEDYVCHSCRGI